MWIWTTHKACTLYVGGNRTHRQNPNVFNPYACLLTIRYLPFCIHINSRCPPTSADTRTRTLITILLVREISNLLWCHYTISASGGFFTWLSPPKDFLVSRKRLNPVPCTKFIRNINWYLHFSNKRTRGVLATSPIGKVGNRTHDKSANSWLLYHWATCR